MNPLGGWAALDAFGFRAIGILLSVLWQSSILLVAAAVLSRLLKRRRAAARFAVWAVALALVPLLPVLGWVASGASAPTAAIPVMPAYTPPPVVMVHASGATGGLPASVSPMPHTFTPIAEPDPVAAPVVPDALPGATARTGSVAPPPSPPSMLSYPWALALVGYGAGAFFFAGVVLVGRMRLSRWVRRGRAVTDERVLRVFAASAERLGLSGREESGGTGGLSASGSSSALAASSQWHPRVRLIEHASAPSPLAMGLVRPVVLLPAGLAERLSDDELTAVALHELAHVGRRDAPVLLVLSCLRAALFFHPLVWLACRQVSMLAEAACDDVVLSVTGQPVPYARMLARLAEELPGRAVVTELAAGFILSKGAFLSRIEAILSHRRDQMRRLSRLALMATILAAAATVALALALPLGEKAGTDKDKKDDADAKAVVAKGNLLPGSETALADLARKPGLFVAVCEVLEDGSPVCRETGVNYYTQKHKVLEVLAGATEAKEAYIGYTQYDALDPKKSERPVVKGDKIIWLAEFWEANGVRDGVPYWSGLKALPDTPDNRKAVAEAAEAAAGQPLVSLLGRKWSAVSKELDAGGAASRIDPSRPGGEGTDAYILGAKDEGGGAEIVYGSVGVCVVGDVIDRVEAWSGPAVPTLGANVVGAVKPGVAVADVEKQYGKPIHEYVGREGQWWKVWRAGDYVVVVWRSYGEGETMERVYAYRLDRLPPKDRLAPYGDKEALLTRLKSLADKPPATGQGLAWAWGDAGAMMSSAAMGKTPAPELGLVTDVKDVVQVAAGANNLYVLTKGGEVWGWGYNAEGKAGRVGDGTNENRPRPVRVVGLADVAAISAKWAHTLALKRDGTVWAWGDNHDRELGDGTSENRPAPVQVKGVKDITAVCAGHGWSAALAKDGSVWVWGTSMEGGVLREPRRLDGTADIVAISGSLGLLALKNDGTVWTCGWAAADPRLTKVEGIEHVKAVACGGHFALALKADGSLWAWGDLANSWDGVDVHAVVGPYDEREPMTTLRRVLDWTDVTAIAAESRATVLRKDGSIWEWGWDCPLRKVEGAPKARAVATGWNISIALVDAAPPAGKAALPGSAIIDVRPYVPEQNGCSVVAEAVEDPKPEELEGGWHNVAKQEFKVIEFPLGKGGAKTLFITYQYKSPQESPIAKGRRVLWVGSRYYGNEAWFDGLKAFDDTPETRKVVAEALARPAPEPGQYFEPLPMRGGRTILMQGWHMAVDDALASRSRIVALCRTMSGGGAVGITNGPITEYQPVKVLQVFEGDTDAAEAEIFCMTWQYDLRMGDSEENTIWIVEPMLGIPQAGNQVMWFRGNGGMGRASDGKPRWAGLKAFRDTPENRRLLGLPAAEAAAPARPAPKAAAPLKVWTDEELIKKYGQSKGRPIDSGFVFVRGRYVEAPYTVSRRGGDVYVNDTRVTHAGMVPIAPNGFPDKPAPLPGMGRDTKLDDLLLPGTLGDSWDRQMVRYLRRQNSDQAKFKDAVLEFYKGLPFIKDAHWNVRESDELILETVRGERAAINLDTCGVHLSAAGENNADLDRTGKALEDSLGKGDAMFYFADGVPWIALIGDKAVPYTDLLAQVSASPKTEAEKGDLVRRLITAAVGSSYAGDFYATLAKEFQPSKPLRDRLDRMMAKDGIKPMGLADIPAAAAPAAAEADWLRAGSSLSLADALKPAGRIVAVCEALDVGTGVAAAPDTTLVEQRVRILEILAGRGEAREVLLDYTLRADNSHYEQWMRRGEKCLWVAEPAPAQPGDKLPRWTGLKALPDTPENRKAVVEAVKAVSAEKIAPAPAELPENLRALATRLNAENARTRIDAIQELNRMGPAAAPAIPLLVKELEDEGQYEVGQDGPHFIVRARREAGNALAHIGPAAVPALLKAMEHKDKHVRSQAAMSVGEIGDRRAAPALLALLGDKVYAVQKAALMGMELLKDPAAVQPLIDYLRTCDPGQREWTFRALGATTGQSFGGDADKWQAWWDANKTLPKFAPKAGEKPLPGAAKAALPGAKVSLREAMKTGGRIAAVCQATTDEQTRDGNGPRPCWQWVKVTEMLAGKTDDTETIVEYARPAAGESALAKGESAIWIVEPKPRWQYADRDQKIVYWEVVKALADTPENRKAVKEAAGQPTLPGSTLADLRPFIPKKADAMLMEAAEDPRPESLGDDARAVSGQAFKIIENLDWRKDPATIHVTYAYRPSIERPIAKGERVVWAVPPGVSGFSAARAFPDTPNAYEDISAAKAAPSMPLVQRPTTGLPMFLPGSEVPLANALPTRECVVAVCQAEGAIDRMEEKRLSLGAEGWQRFKVVQVLAGKTDDKEVDIYYSCSPFSVPASRGVAQGETVIWFAMPEAPAADAKRPQWKGLKAIFDAPLNRKAVAEALGAAVPGAGESAAIEPRGARPVAGGGGFQAYQLSTADPQAVAAAVNKAFGDRALTMPEPVSRSVLVLTNDAQAVTAFIEALDGGKPAPAAEKPAGAVQTRATGTVVDDAGRPVAGAEVVSLGAVPGKDGKGWQQGVVDRGTTGDDGTFSLRMSIVDAWVSATVAARKPGLAVGAVNHVTPDGGVTVVLRPPATLSGVVVDEAGRPVAGAGVVSIVSWEGRLDTLPGDFEPADWLAARTDDKGRFEIKGFSADGRAALRVSAPGYASVETPTYPASALLHPGDDCRVVLPPAAVLRGTVVDVETGKPVAGVKLGIKRAAKDPFESAFSSIPVEAMADGTFSVGGLVAGKYEVATASPDWVAVRQSAAWSSEESHVIGDAREVVIETGDADAKVPVTRGGVLEVRVTDAATGRPVVGASVGSMCVEFSEASGADNPRGLTDKDGVARLRLIGGKYSFGDAQARHYSAWTGEKRFEIARGQVVKEEVQLTPYARAAGVVLDPAGKPVKGAVVWAAAAWEPAATDAAGNFQAYVDSTRLGEKVKPSILVQHAGRGLAFFGPLPAGGPVAVRLEPGFEVSGRIVDPQGKPVAGAEVGVRVGEPWSIRGDGRAAVTDRDGRYTVKALPVQAGAALSLVVRKGGYEGDTGGAPSFPVAAEKGEARIAAKDLVIEPRDKTISGVVVDEAGKPVAGASLTAGGTVDYGSSLGGVTYSVAESKADGTFILKDVAGGECNVTVTGPDKKTFASLKAKGGQGDVRIALVGRRGRGLSAAPPAGKSDGAAEAEVVALVRQYQDVGRREAEALRKRDLIIIDGYSPFDAERAKVTKALQDLGAAAVNVMHAGLKDEKPLSRTEALEMLALIGGEAAVRRGLVEAWPGKIDDPRAVRLLADGCGNRDIDNILVSIGEPAVTALIETVNLRDKDAATDGGWAAACVLMRIGPAAVPALSDLLESGPLPARRHAVQALKQIGDRRAVPAFVKALQSPDTSVRGQAGQALAGIVDPSAKDPLLAAVQRPENWNQAALFGIVQGVAMQRDGRAFDTLVKLTNSDDWLVRRAAIAGLVAVGGEKSLPVLQGLAGDADYRIRGDAAVALGHLRDRRAVPLLIEKLKDKESYVRSWATWALGQTGDPLALPALRELAAAPAEKNEHRNQLEAILRIERPGAEVGSRLTVDQAMQTDNRVVALCEALETKEGVALHLGEETVSQRFKVLELLEGRSEAAEVTITYNRRTTPGKAEAAVVKGDKLIWIAEVEKPADWLGRKAMIDLSDNRQQVIGVMARRLLSDARDSELLAAARKVRADHAADRDKGALYQSLAGLLKFGDTVRQVMLLLPLADARDVACESSEMYISIRYPLDETYAVQACATGAVGLGVDGLLLTTAPEIVRRTGSSRPSLAFVMPPAADLEKAMADLAKSLPAALPAGAKVTRTSANLPVEGWFTASGPGCLIEGAGAEGKPFRLWLVARDWIGIRLANATQPQGDGIFFGDGATYKTIIDASDRATYESLYKAFQTLHMMLQPTLVNGGWDDATIIFKGRMDEADRLARGLVDQHGKTDADRDQAALSLVLLGVPARSVITERALKGKGLARDRCVDALGRFGDKEAARLLAEIVNDPTSAESAGQMYAAQMLERIGDPATGPAMTEAFARITHPDTAMHIAAALAKIRYADAAPKILERMNAEKVPWVKGRYAEALARLGYAQAVPDLEKLCKTKTFSAQWALGPQENWLEGPVVDTVAHMFETSYLRLTGPWGKPADGVRLLLLAPQGAAGGRPVKAALLIENVSDGYIGVTDALAGRVFVNDKPYPLTMGTWIDPDGPLTAVCYNGPACFPIGSVWVHPLDLSRMVSDGGSYAIRYEVGAAKSNVMTVGAAALPGSAKTIEDDLGRSNDEGRGFAAVGEAQDAAAQVAGVEVAGPYRYVSQSVKVASSLRGHLTDNQIISVSYFVSTDKAAPERAVAKGERVLWIGRENAVNSVSGFKVLADTAENRKAVAEAIKAAPPVAAVGVGGSIEPLMLGQMSDLARSIIAAMPEGWKVRNCGRSVAPSRWSGSVACEFIYFEHDTLKAVFPPGPAEFEMYLAPASYAGRLYEAVTAQPGGAGLLAASDTHLMFLEGGLPAEPERSQLEKLWAEKFGFKTAADHGITPAAKKTLVSPPPAAAGAAMPGEGVTLKDALASKGLRFVVVAKAEGDASAYMAEKDAMQASQWFQIVEVLLGDGQANMDALYNYTYKSAGPGRGRAVAKGEQVIVVVRREGSELVAVKIVADTPENRKVVEEAGGPFVLELPDGRKFRIAPDPIKLPARGGLSPGRDRFERMVRESVARELRKDPKADIGDVVFMRFNPPRALPGQPDIGRPEDFKIKDYAKVTELAAEKGGAAAPAASGAEEIITRTYNLGDLVQRRPDDSGPRLWSAGGWKAPVLDASVEAKERAAARDNIAAAIRQTLGPESWQPDGRGTLAAREDSLIVGQTAKNQGYVAELLDQLRQNNIQIAVGVSYVVSSPEVEKKLRGLLPETCRDVMKVWESAEGSFSPAAGMTAEQAAAFLRQAGAVQGAEVLLAQQVAVRVGQRACIRSGSETGVVLADVDHSGERKAMRLQEGMTFRFCATVSADRRYVLVDAAPSYARIVKPGAEPVVASAEPFGDGLPEMPSGSREFSNVVSVLDKSVLLLRLEVPRNMVAGAKRAADEKDDEKAWQVVTKPAQEAAPDFLYVLVEARIVKAAGEKAGPAARAAYVYDDSLTVEQAMASGYALVVAGHYNGGSPYQADRKNPKKVQPYTEWFRVSETLVGDRPAGERVTLYGEAASRPVTDGSKPYIWIARLMAPDCLTGVKVMPDTPENRALVKKAAADHPPTVKPPTYPSDDDLKAAAEKIRLAHPAGGREMWEALAALIEPGMPVRQLDMVLPVPPDWFFNHFAEMSGWVGHPLDKEFQVEALTARPGLLWAGPDEAGRDKPCYVMSGPKIAPLAAEARMDTPADKALLAAAEKVRAAHAADPDKEAMYKALAALVKPGMTDRQLLLVLPGQAGVALETDGTFTMVPTSQTNAVMRPFISIDYPVDDKFQVRFSGDSSRELSGLAGIILLDATPEIIRKPAPVTVKATQPTAAEQELLKYPMLTGSLGKAVKVRAEAATYDELKTRLRPDFVFDEDGAAADPRYGLDMLWIEKGADGKPVFRLDRMFTWKPDGQPARWVVVEQVPDGDRDENFRGNFSGQPMPERLTLSAAPPISDSPLSYAIIKSTDPAGGTLYEIGWAPEMCYGTSLYQSLRLLYVWQDGGGKWRFVGEGVLGRSGGHEGGCAYSSSSTEATVHWDGAPRRPTVVFVATSDVGVTRYEDDQMDLFDIPDRVTLRDAVLRASADGSPAKVERSPEEYMVAAAGDTPEKLVERNLGLAGYWTSDKAERAKVLDLARKEIREKLQALNPKLPEKDIPAGTRVVVSRDVVAAATSAAMPERIRPYVEQLGAAVPQERVAAIQALGKEGKGAAAAVPMLIGLLEDDGQFIVGDAPDGEHILVTVRGEAARALDQITGQDFGADAAKWRAWLKEHPPAAPAPAATATTAAVRVVIPAGAPDALRKEIENTYSEGPDTRAEAILNLTRMKPTAEQAVPRLVELLADEAQFMFVGRIRMPGGGTRDAAPIQDVVGNAAANALANIRTPSTVIALQAACKNANPHVRLRASGALVDQGHKEAADVAAAELGSTDFATRRMAIDVLVAARDKRAIGPLSKILEGTDEDAVVRAARDLATVAGLDFGTDVKKCREWLKANPPAAPAGPGKSAAFAERPVRTLAQAKADINGSELVEWHTNDGPPDVMALKQTEEIGKDAKDQPDALVTVHNAAGSYPEVLRFYGIAGEELRPQVELVSEYGPFEPLKFFKREGREFILVWGHSAGSGGGGPQWVLEKSGPRVRIVPYDNPAEKSKHLLAEGEAPGDWYLRSGAGAAADGLSFSYSLWGPGDAAVAPRAGVSGTFTLQADARTDAIRFIYKDAKRTPLRTEDSDAVTDLNGQIERFNANRPTDKGISPIKQVVARAEYVKAKDMIRCLDKDGVEFLALRRAAAGDFEGTLWVDFHELPNTERYAWGTVEATFRLPKESFAKPWPAAPAAKEAVARKAVEELSALCHSLRPEQHKAAVDWTVGEGREINDRISGACSKVRSAGQAATPFILDRVPQADKWERFWLVEVLSELSDPRAVPTFETYAKGDDADVRGRAFRGLSMGGPVGIPALERLAGEKDIEVQRQTMHACYDIIERTKDIKPEDRGRLVAAAARLRHDADQQVRWMALTVLGKGGAEADAWLIEALADKDSSIREAAMTAIKERRQTSAIPALVKIVQAADPKDYDSESFKSGVYNTVLLAADVAGLALPPLKITRYVEHYASPSEAFLRGEVKGSLRIDRMPVYEGYGEQVRFLLDWWEKDGRAKYAPKVE